MSADLLREAAALMRERAENSAVAMVGPLTWTSSCTAGSKDSMTIAHYRSWHPAVALAVADWLDGVADGMTSRELKHTGRAVAVARAYLGRPA